MSHELLGVKLRSPPSRLQSSLRAFEGFEKENEGGFESFEGEKGFEAFEIEAEGASLTLRRLRKLRSPLHLRELKGASGPSVEGASKPPFRPFEGFEGFKAENEAPFVTEAPFVKVRILGQGCMLSEPVKGARLQIERMSYSPVVSS